jgi:hypothetical protein
MKHIITALLLLTSAISYPASHAAMKSAADEKTIAAHMAMKQDTDAKTAAADEIDRTIQKRVADEKAAKDHALVQATATTHLQRLLACVKKHDTMRPYAATTHILEDFHKDQNSAPIAEAVLTEMIRQMPQQTWKPYAAWLTLYKLLPDLKQLPANMNPATNQLFLERNAPTIRMHEILFDTDARKFHTKSIIHAPQELLSYQHATNKFDNITLHILICEKEHIEKLTGILCNPENLHLRIPIPALLQIIAEYAIPSGISFKYAQNLKRMPGNSKSLQYDPTEMLTTSRKRQHTHPTFYMIGDLTGINGTAQNPRTFPILNLSGNILTQLNSHSFEHCQITEQLILYQNCIDTIEPDTFVPLNTLQGLCLADNSLTQLSPKTFVGLTQLRHLDMHENQLTTIPPETLKHLSKVIDVKLRDNQLTHVPVDLFDMPWLQSIDLDGNPLIPEEQAKYKKLKERAAIEFAAWLARLHKPQTPTTTN